MTTSAPPDVPSRVRQLATELADARPMRRGSLFERTIKCSKPGCACAQDPKARQVLTSRNQFTARAIHDTGSNSVPYETGNIPTFRATRRNKATNIQLSWNRVQSSRTINEVAVVSNYLYLERLPFGIYAMPRTYGLNIKELFGNEMNIYGISSIAISGYTTIR